MGDEQPEQDQCQHPWDGLWENTTLWISSCMAAVDGATRALGAVQESSVPGVQLGEQDVFYWLWMAPLLLSIACCGLAVVAEHWDTDILLGCRGSLTQHCLHLLK